VVNRRALHQPQDGVGTRPNVLGDHVFLDTLTQRSSLPGCAPHRPYSPGRPGVDIASLIRGQHLEGMLARLKLFVALFKNQGQCVAFVNKAADDDSDED
jgi:hypothetical protein